MKTTYTLLALLAALFIFLIVSSSQGAENSQGAEMLRCTQADGTTLYTNKDVQGCEAVRLPELSIVPSVYEKVEVLENAPDMTPSNQPQNLSIHARTCLLYGEWLDVQEKTLGGFNHNTVYDTQRRMLLTQIFGSGFMPVGCQ